VRTPGSVDAFGPFLLDRGRRLLLRDGEPVALTPKAFDILSALAGSAGTVVTRDELQRAVWPHTVVDESNLAFQMSALRKALREKESGERYIATIPGVGYQLVAPLRDSGVPESASPAEAILQQSETMTITVEETSAPRWNPRAILILILLLTVAGFVWLATRETSPGSAAAPPAIRSIAVLPFKPIVAVQRDEALELGMADALIARIGSERDVVVSPLTAVRRYGALDQDPIAAGESLGVDAVLDGSIQNDRSRIRVTARLLRVADRKQLWQGSFDESVAGIFSMQDSITARLASELSLQPRSSVPVHRDTKNVEAYRAYSLGVMHVMRVRRDEIEKGIEYFERAIELDPEYAAAYAELAQAHSILPISSDQPAKESFDSARAAALKAIALDPHLAQAHVVMGSILFWNDWDWAGSEAAFRRAIAIDPNDDFARIRFAHLLSNIGRHAEAAEQGRIAARLDPLSRFNATLNGQFLLQAGDVVAGEDQLKHALRIDPDFWIAHLNLGKAYEMRGRNADAMREFLIAKEGSASNLEPLTMIGYLHGIEGRRSEAQRVLDEMLAISRQRPIPGTKIALVHLGMGNRDEAFASLRRACAERDVGLTFLHANPRWKQLEDDARFAEIERCVNLPG
jgi:DNA-binding winged helix-turn-helix (wHTH) protein/TolB-like protein/Tfp pilus assembly protein PilF